MRRLNKKGGYLEKGLLLYLTLAIACAFYAPQVVFQNDNNALQLLGINSFNQTTGQVIVPANISFNSQINQQIDPTGNQSTGIFQKAVDTVTQGFQSIVDGLGNALGVLKVFWHIIFSPFYLFTSGDMVGAPQQILFTIVFPLIMLFLLGIIYFIRSGT